MQTFDDYARQSRYADAWDEVVAVVAKEAWTARRDAFVAECHKRAGELEAEALETKNTMIRASLLGGVCELRRLVSLCEADLGQQAKEQP